MDLLASPTTHLQAGPVNGLGPLPHNQAVPDWHNETRDDYCPHPRFQRYVTELPRTQKKRVSVSFSTLPAPPVIRPPRRVGAASSAAPPLARERSPGCT